MKSLATLFIAIFLTPGWIDAETPAMVPQKTPRKMAITVDDLPVAQPSWHTPEQMEKLEDRRKVVTEERIREVEAEWPVLIAEV